MQSFLGVAIILALLSLVASQAQNSSQSMDLYILQNQRQYDAKIKQLADELANFKQLFQKQINALDVQADSMQLKLEQASAHLDPIILIDSWSKQCVQNYSVTIPTITVARDSIIKCKESISGILNAPESTYNTLNNYYKNNVKNGLAQCLKLHPTAQLNYTLPPLGVASSLTIPTMCASSRNETSRMPGIMQRHPDSNWSSTEWDPDPPVSIKLILQMLRLFRFRIVIVA